MFMANEYKNQLMTQAFGTTTSSEDYVVDLFTNNVTVSDTTSHSALTPGAWTGYSQVSVPRSTFSAALTGNISYLLSSVVPQFTNGSGSGVNVYGWMMRGASSGLLVCSQNFASPPVSIPATYVLTLYPFQIGGESY
jgi:hypothetical protein